MNGSFKKLIAVVMVGIVLVSGCQKKEENVDVDTSKEKKLVNTIEFDGKEMSYLRFGNADGKKVVILPGVSLKSVMGSAEAIEAAYASLAENYEVYLLDHIKEEPEGYQIEDMADDTYKVLQLLGLDEIGLMGVSMGGMVSQVLAVRHPENVKALILCSTSANVKDGDRNVFEIWAELAEARDNKKLMESFGQWVYDESFYEQYKDAIIASGEGACELDYQNFLISLKAMQNFKISDQLDQISCPVLVLTGDRAKLCFQASLDIIAELGCQYFIYEGYGHAVYDEAPDFLSHVTGFLDSLSD